MNYLILVVCILFFSITSGRSQSDYEMFHLHQINIHNGHNIDDRDFGHRIFEMEDGYFILNFNQAEHGWDARQWNAFIQTNQEGDLQSHHDFYSVNFGNSLCNEKNAVKNDTIFLSYSKRNNNLGTVAPAIISLEMRNGEVINHNVFEELPTGYDRAMEMSSDNLLRLIHAKIYGYSEIVHFSSISKDLKIDTTAVINHGYPDGFNPTHLKEGPEGTFWLAGVGKNLHSDQRYTSVLFKVDKFGNIEDEFQFDQPQSIKSDTYLKPFVKVLENGNLLFVTNGEVPERELGRLRAINAIYVYKLNPEGNILWERHFETAGFFSFSQFLELNNGDFLGLGRATLASIDSGEEWEYYGTGGWIFRLDRDGNLLWERKIQDESFYPPVEFEFFNRRDRLFWFSDAIEREDGSFLITGMAAEYSPPIDEIPFHHDPRGILMLTLNANGCITEDCSKIDQIHRGQYFAPVGARWYYRNYHEDIDHHSYTMITAVKDTFVGERHCRLLEVYRSELDKIVAELIVFQDDRTVYFYEEGEFLRLYQFHHIFPFHEFSFHVPSNYHLYNPAIPYDPDHPPYPRETHYAITGTGSDVIKLSEDIDFPGWRIELDLDYVQTGNEYEIELGKVTDYSGGSLGFAGRVGETPDEGYPGYLRCYYDPEFGWFNFSEEPCDFTSSVVNIPAAVFDVFPNPTSNFLRVSGLEEYQLENYRIVNMDGKTVGSGQFSQDQIDVSRLAAGIYILVVSSDTHEAKKQFTKF